MSDLTIDAILKDCDLGTIDFIVPVADDATKAKASAAFVKAFAFVKALYDDVKNEEAKAAKVEGPKPDAPHVKAWKADKKAAKQAETIVAKMVEDLAKYEGNDALMFHLRATVRDTLSKYLANEVEYGEWKAERSAPIDPNVAKGTKAVNADRYKVGRIGLGNLWNISGHFCTVPSEMLTTDKGSLVLNLPSLGGGNYGGNGAAASGRYAPLYSKVAYKVDGKSFTDPREVVRAIWTGSMRVGKNTADLWSLLEGHKINPATITDPVTITENGHSIVVSKKG